MTRKMRLSRIAVVAPLAAMALATAGVAQAGEAVPAAPSANDVAAARNAVGGALGTVGQFFAAGGRKPQGDAKQLAAAAMAAAPRIDSATVPVYSLAPAFGGGEGGLAGLIRDELDAGDEATLADISDAR